MEIAPFNSSVVIILTAGFFFATLLGVLTLKAKLSPIPGYLIAGYIIGPYSPGFIADVHIAEQLAEIGVILMMFNVGLHIHMQELLDVKRIAIPGAIFQILVSATAGIFLIHLIGWPITSGVIFGIAISVASTMILVKMLTDHNLLKTDKGHISVGWLIVEDLITILFLLLIPILATLTTMNDMDWMTVAKAILSAFGYFLLLVLIMATIGKKYVEWVLNFILKSKSKELLTLAVLSLIFQIAIGAALFFGTSIALGAFIAGLVMGQMSCREEIAKNSESLKDVFCIIFFLAIGMLFNPLALISNMSLLIGALLIILILKPLAAFVIIYLFKYPIKTALLVAIALAQIGEFSFIVAEEASRMRLLPDEGYDIIVGAALISISLNPILFNQLTKHSKS